MADDAVVSFGCDGELLGGQGDFFQESLDDLIDGLVLLVSDLLDG
jgi:hypothetical protein